ncbi:MAG: amino acid ABC transporter permease, partial [Pseudomonadota bacterium]
VRGTPILVQVYAAYFLLPMTGLDLSPFWVGTVALVFNSAGYQIEIARGAILSIPAGQAEGAGALGLRRGQTLRLVILPQALARMWPALANEASNLVKASSVLSVIAVFELHKAANAIISQSYKFLEMLAAQALLYLAFVVLLTQLARWLERRAGRMGDPAPGALR